MKHSTFSKCCGSARLLCLLALVALTANVAKADLIFSESFDYTTGDLYGQGGWARMGAKTEKPIQVISDPLTYAGYQTKAVGGAAKTVASNKQAQDLMKRIGHLANVDGNVAYIGALLKVDTVGTNNFLAICDSAATYSVVDGKSPSEKIKLYALAGSTDNKFKFAIGKAGGTNCVNYVSTEAEYDLKSTYLVVIKYEFVVAPEDKDSAKTRQDDRVYLFVNPDLTAEPTTENAVVTLSGTTYGDDISYRGANAIALKQRQYLSTTCPTVTVDNIRIATAWNDLLTESKQTTTPTITVSPTALDFDELLVGNAKKLTFTVSGKNLEEAITLESNNQELVLNPTTITKDDAQKEDGVEVTATLTAATAGKQSATITLSSKNATAKTIAASWTAYAVTEVETIDALKKGVAADTKGEIPFKYTGEAVVTYSEASATQTQVMYYVEDATGAVRIDEWYEESPTIDLKVGDKIQNAIVFKGEDADQSGQPLIFMTQPTVVSSGNALTPQVVTLKQLQTNAADYLLELVKVEGVAFDLSAEKNYIVGDNAISQSDVSAVVSLTADNALVNTAKPATADITGISYYTTGNHIRVRSAEDIVAKTTPTAIETIALDQLTDECEIYTVSGMRVHTLQQGINIIRQGDKIYKLYHVVR